ncbi:helix-turn-helix domain-containing protein [Chryseobacterium soli]|uniref:Transposase n=1 Tax=Chryseobacterium soli TaxID=445961 RepID=A0A086A2V9_9FLAO|nr:helix-turn-helix domain-containing protein [Chryseobacterium soli]KFF11023.1 transposase [Chryseobacterium soli]MDV7697965.1 helix-turn-helix domain-containing protein [Chryseobacterium soli]
MSGLNFKNIHVGFFLEQRVNESQIEITRICKFLDCDERDVKRMFQSKNLDCDLLLQWSKLLKYDFFRLYSQHLILYSPQSAKDFDISSKKTNLPQFRKNIYTKEIIEFMLELISNGNKTKQQIIEEYNIPKTTLYKWINKYQKI